MDKIDADRRSANMRRIGQKNTRPEIAVRKAAHAMGLRFRLHRKDLPGRPDLVMSKHMLAIFVHGCFWHRHPGCSNCTNPQTRVDFWAAKFAANTARDKRVAKGLHDLGWRVVTIWECETSNAEMLRKRLKDAIAEKDTH